MDDTVHNLTLEEGNKP